MRAYVDTSVLLRIVLRQPDQLQEWGQLDRPVTSRLTRVECLRTLDRGLQQGRLLPPDLAERRALAQRLLAAFDVIEITPAVLERAEHPFPTPLRTLDAVHLVSALLWRANQGDVSFATHDVEQAVAAKALGFTVLGV